MRATVLKVKKDSVKACLDDYGVVNFDIDGIDDPEVGAVYDLKLTRVYGSKERPPVVKFYLGVADSVVYKLILMALVVVLTAGILLLGYFCFNPTKHYDKPGRYDLYPRYDLERVEDRPYDVKVYT